MSRIPSIPSRDNSSKRQRHPRILDHDQYDYTDYVQPKRVVNKSPAQRPRVSTNPPARRVAKWTKEQVEKYFALRERIPQVHSSLRLGASKNIGVGRLRLQHKMGPNVRTLRTFAVDEMEELLVEAKQWARENPNGSLQTKTHIRIPARLPTSHTNALTQSRARIKLEEEGSSERPKKRARQHSPRSSVSSSSSSSSFYMRSPTSTKHHPTSPPGALSDAGRSRPSKRVRTSMMHDVEEFGAGPGRDISVLQNDTLHARIKAFRDRLTTFLIKEIAGGGLAASNMAV